MLDAIISTTPYLFTKDFSNIIFYANVKYICSHFHNRVRSKLELPADLNWSSLQIWASCQVQSGKWFLCDVLQYKTYFCGSLSLFFPNDGHCFISNYSKNRPAPLPAPRLRRKPMVHDSKKSMVHAIYIERLEALLPSRRLSCLLESSLVLPSSLLPCPPSLILSLCISSFSFRLLPFTPSHGELLPSWHPRTAPAILP